ncbi:MAG: glutamate--tRNA ligase [Planctomycetota bacterium]
MTDAVRVRFAPSPTGYLHIGGARTALYNWLYARQKGGTFVLRMEDTDAARNTDAARETIFRGLDWLGLTPDEGPEQGGPFGPYSQSERQDLYRHWANQLIEIGAVYPCFATKKELAELRAKQEAAGESTRYDGRYRDLDPAEAKRRIDAGEEHTWRLRVPEDETVEVDDEIRGVVRVETKDIEDIILIRGNGMPIYNFVVVIDDHLMEISHVIRGEDHLTNTFKQVLIFKALGWDTPRYAHLPLILGPTGSGKLSKRKHPEAALELYQQKGYPEAGLVNWLASVGWSLDDKTEVMTRDELIERFSLASVNRSGARLPLDKLDWICGDYLRRFGVAEIEAGIRPYLQQKGWVAEPPTAEQSRQLRVLARAQQERLRFYSQIVEDAAWIYEGVAKIEGKAMKNLKKAGAPELLEEYLEFLGTSAACAVDASAMETRAKAWAEQRELGIGKLMGPLRSALTGKTQGPGVFDCAEILGNAEVAARIKSAVAAGRAAQSS